MKLALFLPSLDAGGAQRQFAQLAAAMAGRGHDVLCLTLVPGGPYWDGLARSAGVRLLALEARRRPDGPGLGRALPRAALRLARVLRAERPDVVYSALHVANLLAWAATAGGRMLPLCWGIRAAGQDLPWRRRLPYELCRLGSGRVDLLVANSSAGLAEHAAHGYRARRSAVIPNGIDTDLFRPDPEARQAVRAELGVGREDRLVGIVGRLAPVKDHPTFLAAAARLAAACPGTRFVCVGGGPAAYRDRLAQEARVLGLADRLHWAGERPDMARVYNAFDLSCLSSRSEGFPNVLAEAMACGVPCAATTVGDAATILGDTGELTAPGDPVGLAGALDRLLALSPEQRQSLGQAARARVVERFGFAAMLERTEAALQAVVDQRAAPRGKPARGVGARVGGGQPV